MSDTETSNHKKTSIFYKVLDKMSINLSNKLSRVTSVRLCYVLLPMFYKQISDSPTLLVLLFVLLSFFQILKWKMFSEFIITLIVNIVINITTNFKISNSKLFTFYNLSIIFIFIQMISTKIPQEFATKIIGNIQWIYSNTILSLLNEYVHNDVITTFVLLFLIFILKNISVNNNDIIMIYSMATIQNIQNLIIRSIPLLFLAPSCVCIIFFLRHFVVFFDMASDLYDFIMYTTANSIYDTLKQKFSIDITIYISIIGIFAFSALKIDKAEQIMQILVILVFVDYFVQLLSVLFSSDPILSLFLFSFFFKIVQNSFAK